MKYLPILAVFVALALWGYFTAFRPAPETPAPVMPKTLPAGCAVAKQGIIVCVAGATSPEDVKAKLSTIGTTFPQEQEKE